jgi:methylmalonyl-CoA mutase N-terminal domain/subunit
VARVTLQALAAVLGGTQSLHTNSRDEALALPAEDSVSIALRTQQIIAHESGVADTTDPLAGSYVVEYLTNQIEERAKAYIDKIDAIGGALASIDLGFMQREIVTSAYEQQQAIETQAQIVVGVNRFCTEEGQGLSQEGVSPLAAEQQIARLGSLRENRDNDRVGSLLKRLGEAAEGTGPLMPILIDCVAGYATMGEICGALRGVFGEYEAPAVL